MIAVALVCLVLAAGLSFVDRRTALVFALVAAVLVCVAMLTAEPAA